MVKKSFLIITSLFQFFIFFSCKTKTYEYKTISYEDISPELEAHIDIPEFADSNLADLNNILGKQKKDFEKIVYEYRGLWNEWYHAGLGFDNNTEIPLPQFSYNQKYEVHFSKNLISILFTLETYAGGPHGNLQYLSFCYNTKEKKLCTIEEASGMSARTISEKCISILMETIYDNTDDTDIGTWVESGAGIDSVSKMNFTIDDGSVTVYFAPYEVASYAEGPVTVKLR